jgi:hypothetical protein
VPPSKSPWSIWKKGGRYHRFVEGTVVPKTFLPGIGYVVVAFSRLDVQLDLTIAHLVGADRELGRAIAAAIPNYRPRIELFSRIIDLKVPDETDRKFLHKIASATSAVADERHRLIHDYMDSLSVQEQKLNLSRKESIFREKPKPTEVTVSTLKSLGDRMTDLSYRLQRFTKADPRWKSGAQFPWRDQPRKRSHRQNPRQLATAR